MKRTRLTAIYLTATERDTIRQALDEMASYMLPQNKAEHMLYASSLWARSFSRQRLLALKELFADKPPPTT